MDRSGGGDLPSRLCPPCEVLAARIDIDVAALLAAPPDTGEPRRRWMLCSPTTDA